MCAFPALGCLHGYPGSGAGWHLTGQPRECVSAAMTAARTGMPVFNLAVSVRLAVVPAVPASGPRLYLSAEAAALYRWED